MYLICTPKPSLLTLHERLSVSIIMPVCTLQDLQSISYTVPLKHLAVSVKVEVLSILQVVAGNKQKFEAVSVTTTQQEQYQCVLPEWQDNTEVCVCVCV